MKERDAFSRLFQEAYQKCFSHELSAVLTESESRHFSSEIFEQTGLVVGWKSLKNYSHFVLGKRTGKPENPSVPTLDTLARYVADAPATDEVRRKRHERHYPYWFRYRDAASLSDPEEEQADPEANRPNPRRALAAGGGLALGVLLLVLFLQRRSTEENFSEAFDTVAEDSLASVGWRVQSRNDAFWELRGSKAGHLTLFTLRGDNWPASGLGVDIQNMVLRVVRHECFDAELHLTDFVPFQNWQQAGLMLLEDTTLHGKSLRMSIAYNDFFGGFEEKGEIIVQAVATHEGRAARPEEVVHHRLFSLDETSRALVQANMAHSVLRLEKRRNQVRLLYATSPLNNAALKEIATTPVDVQARYIGLFALKGFETEAPDIPAFLDGFTLARASCEE